jgi:hypothetical protein
MIVYWKSSSFISDYKSSFQSLVFTTNLIGLDLTDYIQNNLKIDANKIHCIGHSLGAHACGNCDCET